MNPEQSQIRRVEPGSVIPFPCWMFDYAGWLWLSEAPGPLNKFTHWHPDQPKPPTAIPAIEELRQQQKGGSGLEEWGTLDVYTQCHVKGQKWVKFEIALELEREVADLRKQIENQASIIRESCLPANEREARLLRELAEARLKTKAEAAWASEVMAFVKADPSYKEDESVSGKCLEFLQERKKMRDCLRVLRTCPTVLPMMSGAQLTYDQIYRMIDNALSPAREALKQP